MTESTTKAQLDKWTATHVMGWYLRDGDWCDGTGMAHCPDWSWTPTTDDRQAWQVAQLLVESGWDIVVENYSVAHRRPLTWVVNAWTTPPEVKLGSVIGTGEAVGESLPFVICQAIKSAWERREAREAEAEATA